LVLNGADRGPPVHSKTARHDDSRLLGEIVLTVKVDPIDAPIEIM
jgi:hypothetical protein